MKYNSIGEQLIAKAQELDPSYKPDKFNDMSEAIDVILNNSGGGYKIKKLYITENGLYDNDFEAYKPVVVDVPQISEDGTLLKTLLDETKTAHGLFRNYKGISVDNLINYIDTSKVTNMESMFAYCSNLTSVPLLATFNVTTMSDMFTNCNSLTTIPELDTSNVTIMEHMFSNCSNLISIPKLDTSKVVNMIYMFYNCSNLKSIPLLNTSNVREMQSFVEGCSSLTTFPELDTSNVTSFYGCFKNCSQLTSIPNLQIKDDSNSRFEYMFDGCSSLTSIGMYGFAKSINISQTALEHDALVAFLNQAGTANNRYGQQKITMGSAKLALLSDQEKAIATNKGWTLA